MNRKIVFQWLFISLIYFIWFGLLVGLRTEHTVLWCFSTTLWFINSSTRNFLLHLAAWLCYWMLYDSLRIAPNYTVSKVHIQDLYELDKNLFGIYSNEIKISLNEWCTLHKTPILDVIAAIFYISWVPLPILFSIVLYFTNRPLYHRFTWGFLTVNIIGFVIYYIFPAAPPWYVAEHGFDFNINVPRSAAGLNRVDQLFEIELFKKIYTRNSNIFAAMPSLHSAYPLITLFYAVISKQKWAITLFSITSIGIWFSAIYTNHHYILDVAAGIGVAIMGYFVFEKVIFKHWIIFQKRKLKSTL
jgi:inositol phosphorylceramide synthase catalytic subunit